MIVAAFQFLCVWLTEHPDMLDEKVGLPGSGRAEDQNLAPIPVPPSVPRGPILKP